MFIDLEPQWSKPRPQRCTAHCCSCEKSVVFPAVDLDDAIRQLAEEEWLWNGEELWCPECLKNLAENVP